MQNAKCKMQNCGRAPPSPIIIIHYSLFIIHYSLRCLTDMPFYVFNKALPYVILRLCRKIFLPFKILHCVQNDIYL